MKLHYGMISFLANQIGMKRNAFNAKLKKVKYNKFNKEQIARIKEAIDSYIQVLIKFKNGL